MHTCVIYIFLFVVDKKVIINELNNKNRKEHKDSHIYSANCTDINHNHHHIRKNNVININHSILETVT